MILRNLNGLLLVCIATTALVVSGCGQSGTTESDSGQATHGAHEEEHGHDHGGWWCVEHGIPEEECGMCNTKLAADLRAQGDWCEEHKRPDSQCFVCHPENAEKYAALYEAKYGEMPPEPTE